ncbi:hypothetical protein JTE90_025942, partial [Oedothorax gibbosus]
MAGSWFYLIICCWGFRKGYDTREYVDDLGHRMKAISKLKIAEGRAEDQEEFGLHAENEYTSTRFPLATMKRFVTDSALRDASTEADKIPQAFDVELSMRRDVFRNLTVLKKKQV